jgi:hypothetical protein
MIKARDGCIVSERDSNGVGSRDRALNRIIDEIYSGLRHGYFEYALTCEVIGPSGDGWSCTPGRATSSSSLPTSAP